MTWWNDMVGWHGDMIKRMGDVERTMGGCWGGKLENATGAAKRVEKSISIVQ